jgi:4-hydroxy-tetrahydrodipicolinate synthase
MPDSPHAENGQLRGVFPALVTPFADEGQAIDESALRALVDHSLDGGVDGFVVCGGTGEFDSLTGAERRRSIEIVVEQTAGRASVVAQTGALSTIDALEHSKHAVASGADVLMIGLPFYEPLNTEQVITYFSTIADAVDVPLMAYNYPRATGFNLSPDVLAELVAAVPSVAYLKDSAGDLGQIHATAARPEHVSVFSGSDVQSVPALLMGATGLVNGASQVFPTEFAKIYAAATAGDNAGLIEHWTRLLPFLTFAERNPYPSAIKHALRITGVPIEANVRRPAPDLSTSALYELEGILAKLA